MKRKRILIIFVFIIIAVLFFKNYIFSNNNELKIPAIQVVKTNDYKPTHVPLLVNSENKAPDELPNDMVLVKVIDYVKTLNTDILLDKEAIIMLKEMFNAAADVGYTEFRVTEGYRTEEYQRALYDSAANKSLVALPGHSEHQTGLAVDISYNGINIENSKQGKWLMANAYKYGFILRYPKNKTHITGFPYEPWHYRYVGQPHAEYIHDNGLCLEEYIKIIQEDL